VDEFIVGLDLGQSRDYTALAVLQRIAGASRAEAHYHLRHLERPPLGTLYTAIVQRVQGLLATPPLHVRRTPLVVDRTGVGAAVLDMFTAAGLRPHAVTITGGDSVVRESQYHVRVPKRELVGLLVALFQSGRLKVARDLELAPALLDELLNFRVKVNLQTAHDSYEAWRESAHDDLVLATALACWHAENAPGPVRIFWSDEDDVYETNEPAISPHYWRHGRR
jgi:hypothetical protein